MDEHELRCQQFGRELLDRHGATSLADLGARELEAFRTGGGIHVTDPAWLLLVEHWKAMRREDAVNVTELETWPDANLQDLLCRNTLPRVQENAALELYRRGSKYLGTPEFAPFRTMCVDRELKERKAAHDPARVLDALQRINEKAENNAVTLASINRAHTLATAELEQRQSAATADAITTLRSELNSRASALQQTISDIQAAAAKSVKKLVIWLGGLTGVTVLVILSHLIWRI